MSDIRYAKEHEWVRMEGDLAVIGISDYAQSELGDVVYVEMPAVGTALTKDAEACTVESVKAASEVYAPISGEVVEVNGALEDDPVAVNTDPTGAGWFIKVRPSKPAELDSLMDQAAYDTYVASLK